MSPSSAAGAEPRGAAAEVECEAVQERDGFEQPPEPHQHWHVDVSYINISGTFYYLCSVLDGFSRSIVQWDLRESMKETDVEIILQSAKEKHPPARPRIISDNGPQFIAKDFKELIRIPANRVGDRRHLFRPPGRPSRKPLVRGGRNRERSPKTGK